MQPPAVSSTPPTATVCSTESVWRNWTMRSSSRTPILTTWQTPSRSTARNTMSQHRAPHITTAQSALWTLTALPRMPLAEPLTLPTPPTRRTSPPSSRQSTPATGRQPPTSWDIVTMTVSTSFPEQTSSTESCRNWHRLTVPTRRFSLAV